MLELKIYVDPKENQDKVATMIHESLVGWDQYKCDNVLLNKDGDYITLLIGPDRSETGDSVSKDKILKLICKTESIDPKVNPIEDNLGGNNEI